MEQNTLQPNALNNVHESDFSGFINNGLQQPTNVIQAERSSTNPNNNLGVSSYNTNNVPATYVNTQINSPFNSPEIFTCEIPGYDVIFIRKPSQLVTLNNLQDHASSTVNPLQLNQQQSYVYGINGTSVGGSSVNAINTLNVYDNNLQPQQNSLEFNGSFNNYNNFRG